MLEKAAELKRLQTGVPLLDSFLQGGIPSNSITELVGAPGIGKTQLCHMLVANALRFSGDRESSTVLYLDSENAFSAQRIRELMTYENEICPSNPPFPDVAAAIERVKVRNVKSSSSFSELLDTLDAAIIESNVKLVILDSVAALVRHEFDSASVFKRQNLLTLWASRLKAIAEDFNIPVIVTNQVTSYGPNDGDPMSIKTPIAALGTGWYHSVNTRLTLQMCRPGDFGISPNSTLAYLRNSAPVGCPISSEWLLRCMAISKSPISPVVSFPYFIVRSGLCLLRTLSIGNGDSTDEKETFVYEMEPANYWFNA